MLTLMPLTSLQSALKRKNSKTYDFSRRGSLSVYSTYSLPSSKTYMRRFSSYEELAPIFSLLAPADKDRSLTKKMGRRPSRKSSSSSEPGDLTDGLDAQLANIRERLAQLKNDDIELTQRVDDLHTSVNDVCRSHQSRRSSSTSLGVITESSWETAAKDESTSGDEDDLSSGDEDEESFEDYCKSVLPKLGARSAVSSPALNVLSDPKRHCLLNNTFRSKASSAPQLDIIRNDLSDELPSSSRLSVVSV